MNYQAASQYAEAILMNQKAVKKSLAAEKKKREGLRASFYGGAGRPDPTANSGIHNVDTIPVLVCISDKGETFTVKNPERWLDVISKSFLAYKDLAGIGPWESMYHRYDKCWSINKICAIDGISKRTAMFRRRDFLAVLLVYAAQSGIISLE